MSARQQRYPGGQLGRDVHHLPEVGSLDEDRLREEVVEAAAEVVRADSAVGAFLLECSDLPRYARCVQEATGLPVFDWSGFIRYVHDAVNPRDYHHGTY